MFASYHIWWCSRHSLNLNFTNYKFHSTFSYLSGNLSASLYHLYCDYSKQHTTWNLKVVATQVVVWIQLSQASVTLMIHECVAVPGCCCCKPLLHITWWTQWRSQKLTVGRARCGRKATSCRGVWGHAPPGKFSVFWCSEVHFWHLAVDADSTVDASWLDSRPWWWLDSSISSHHVATRRTCILDYHGQQRTLSQITHWLSRRLWPLW